MKKNKGGRPAKYQTAEELQSKIDEYFREGVEKRKVLVGRGDDRIAIEIPTPTICGLVLYCGFCSRQSFYDMEQLSKFTYTIKKARLRMEMEYESLLREGLGAGAIFALKNFGWKDEQHLKGEGFSTNIIVNNIKTILENAHRVNRPEDSPVSPTGMAR